MCSNVSEVCCKCFISMLQKYLDVAHVATVFSSVCPKHFICFQTYVASVSSRYCIYIHVASVCFKCFGCFIRIFQVFYLNIAYILQWLQTCFSYVSDV
jgi:hypothetical protein